MSDQDVDDLDGDLTPAGHLERRQASYVTRGEFRRWRNRTAALFLVLAAVSCLAGYLGYSAGRSSDAGLSDAARDTAYTSCIGGAELRIAVAAGFDELRRLAIIGAPKNRADVFIARTQPAIDRLLTQAAGTRYRAPLPPGEVNVAVAGDVLSLADGHCRERVAQTYGGLPRRLR